jgi:hypothetical protein
MVNRKLAAIFVVYQVLFGKFSVASDVDQGL